MVASLSAVLVSILAMSPPSLPGQTPSQEAPSPASVPSSQTVRLPPVPPGRSTVIGGELRDLDPVRDQFTLKVFGGRSMKILFDERTQAFRDGKRVPILKLHPEDHASVETTLDGTRIFALKIHMLSHLPEGECQGQVSAYNPQTGDLTVKPTSETSVTLHMSPQTAIMHLSQDSSSTGRGEMSDLVKGAMVDVTFNRGAGGRATAIEVDVLASPGSAFVFTGPVSFLDVQAGRLVMVDAKDHQSHEVFFNPARFPISRDLHEGSSVKVTTSFDGSRYLVSDIAVQ